MKKVVTIRLLKDPEERAALYDLRGRVLRPGRPPEDSHFPGDDAPTTVHWGAFIDEQCVGVASLFAERGVRLRGMAVEPHWRGQGVGAALLHPIQRMAAQNGQNLWCSARVSAVDFYEKLGWKTEGDVFDVPLIGPHYIMRWQASGSDAAKNSG